MPELLQAIKTEMTLRCDYVVAPDTLYIGGGTPSLYSAGALGGLVKAAQEVWHTDFKEVTIEVNPEDVTLDFCRALADHGVNRLSFGIQSFFDAHLQFMNRRHSAIQGIRAVEAARCAGFKNISVDLIFGFPGLSMRQWEKNIEQALALAPEHLSAYQLGIERGTPFFKAYERGLLQPVSTEAAAAQYALLQALLPEAGIEQYEVSNFAREGYRSRHNSAYWRGVPYVGLGPSAHSFHGNERHAHVRCVKRYLEGINKPPLQMKKERITLVKRYNEFILTRLRTVEGFSRFAFEQAFGEHQVRRHFQEAAARLLRQGLLREQAGRIYIPRQKLFVMDGIVVDLVMVPKRKYRRESKQNRRQ